MKATLSRRLVAEDTPGFIVAQLAGAAAATLVMRWLVVAPEKPR